MNRQNKTAQHAGTIPTAVTLPCHGGDGAQYSHQACISGSSPTKTTFLSTQSKSKQCPGEIVTRRQPTLLGLLSREGLKSKALLSLHKSINYAVWWCGYAGVEDLGGSFPALTLLVFAKVDQWDRKRWRSTFANLNGVALVQLRVRPNPCNEQSYTKIRFLPLWSFFIVCFRHSIYKGICLPMKGREKFDLLSQIFMTPTEGRGSHLKIIYYG